MAHEQLDIPEAFARAQRAGVKASRGQAAANFETAKLSGITVNAAKITARDLQVSVPANTTSAQWDQINKAIQYGQSQGVTVKITVVK